MSYSCEHFQWTQVRGQDPHEAVPAWGVVSRRFHKAEADDATANCLVNAQARNATCDKGYVQLQRGSRRKELARLIEPRLCAAAGVCGGQTKNLYPSVQAAGKPLTTQAWSTGTIAVSAPMLRNFRSINRFIRRAAQTSNRANSSSRQNLVEPAASLWGGIPFKVQLVFWIAHGPERHLAMRLIRGVNGQLIGGTRFSTFSVDADFPGLVQEGLRPMPQAIRGQ